VVASGEDRDEHDDGPDSPDPRGGRDGPQRTRPQEEEIGRALRRLLVLLARAFLRLLGRSGRAVRGEYVKLVGGAARARVIFALGGVLALSSADGATVGAIAPQLEHSLRIGNAKVGLLSSVALLVGAFAVIPVGLLVDRIKRMPLLSLSVAIWSLATLLGAFSSSYWHLLLWRLALGIVTATAGPAVASLTGDYFPARERGRVYAYILAGETAGTAVGFILSSSIASLISWRAAFVMLAVPGFLLAWRMWRTVPEPARGGQSRLEPGTTDLVRFEAAMVDTGQATDPAGQEPVLDELAWETARRRGIKPNPRLVLTEDPQQLGLVEAVRYTLRIPSNFLMIVSSSLGYFYFSGVQTFALLFVRGHYHVGQATSELGLGTLVIGALLGTLASGHLTDAMLRQGVLNARVIIPAVCYLGSVVLLVGGILVDSFDTAVWLFAGGMALISAANPPLNAARLDIMPAGLWGRAESTRTFVRSLSQAVAPLAFGGFADLIAGIVPVSTPPGTHPGLVSPSTARGLEIAFLVMLSTVAAAGLLLLRAARSYPTDIATAAASRQDTADVPADR
jgi:MFS family permease